MTPNPTKIIVPRQHGELLIEPPLAQVATAPRLSPSDERAGIATLFNIPDTTLRAAARHTLVAAVKQHANNIGEPPPDLSPDQPLILTGHQVEFYHPGVWAKVIAADELARRIPGAQAIDLLVDHDLVDHLGFDVPAQNPDESWHKDPIEFAPAQPLPAESLHAPTLAQFDAWDSRLAAFPAIQTDSLAFFLSSLRPTARRDRSPGVPSAREPYVRWMSRARTSFENSMGLNVPHVPATSVCTGPAWDAFVSGWIHHAEQLTSLYNHHLAAYRHRQNIKSAHHPMPDLDRTPDSGRGGTFELPFWIYKKGEPRERLHIRTSATPLILFQNQELDAPSALRDPHIAIRPRALSMTMFARLFLADLFIHGIGGTLYDQITDAILQDLFHTTPPYACVSAAWLLPLGGAGKEITTDDDLAALHSRRHHIQHNPQLAIDPFTALKTDVAELITARRHHIEQLTTSLQTARKDPTAKQERRRLFDQLHSLNTQLHAKSPRILQNLDHQLETASRALAENKVLLWREWFFALHTTDSLNKLITRIRTP